MDSLVTTALTDPEGIRVEPAQPIGVGILVLAVDRRYCRSS